MPVDLSSSSPRFSAKHCLAVLVQKNRNTSNLCCAFLFRLCSTDLNFNKWQKCSQKRKQIATTFSPLELICPENNNIIVQEGAMKKFNITRMVFTTIDKVFALPQNPPSVSRKLYDVRCIADIAYSKQYPDMKLDLYFHADQKKKYTPSFLKFTEEAFPQGTKSTADVCASILPNTQGQWW